MTISVDSPHNTDHGGFSFRARVIQASARWTTDQRDLVHLLAEFDLSGEWALDGARTAAHWLADVLDLELRTLREWLRIGHALRRLTAIDEAFAAQRISYSKVRAITRVAKQETEHALLKIAEEVPASQLPYAIAAWLGRHETPAETEERHRTSRFFRWWLEPDGMVAGSFRLAPADAAAITAPVDADVARNRLIAMKDFAPTNTAEGDEDASAGPFLPRKVTQWPTLGQQRADALMALVERGGRATITTEVVVHARGDGCTFDDGTPIAGSVVERLASDAFLRALIHDAEGRPINASDRQRHPTKRQKRVVRERDPRCVDCGSIDLLSYDHVPDFAISHQTIVDELEPRCAPCHRARHDRVQHDRDDPNERAAS